MVWWRGDRSIAPPRQLRTARGERSATPTELGLLDRHHGRVLVASGDRHVLLEPGRVGDRGETIHADRDRAIGAGLKRRRDPLLLHERIADARVRAGDATRKRGEAADRRPYLIDERQRLDVVPEPHLDLRAPEHHFLFADEGDG